MIHTGIPWVADGYNESLVKRSNSGGTIVESIDNVLKQTGAGSGIPDHESNKERVDTNGSRRVKSASSATRINTNFYLPKGYSRTRPKSAFPKQQLRTGQGTFQGSPRPKSAQVPLKKPLSGLPCRRVRSAGSATRATQPPGNLNKSYTMIVRAYEHGKFEPSINFNPDCSYFDRHSRCFDHNHMHSKLMWTRPQKPCRVGGWCGPPTQRDLDEYVDLQGQTTGSPGRKRPDDSWEVELDERQLRYVASLRPWTSATRPRTAPTTRKELQGVSPKNNFDFNSDVPHFCNFVAKKPIMERGVSEISHAHSHYSRQKTTMSNRLKEVSSFFNVHATDEEDLSDHGSRPNSHGELGGNPGRNLGKNPQENLARQRKGYVEGYKEEDLNRYLDGEREENIEGSYGEWPDQMDEEFYDTRELVKRGQDDDADNGHTYRRYNTEICIPSPNVDKLNEESLQHPSNAWEGKKDPGTSSGVRFKQSEQKQVAKKPYPLWGPSKQYNSAAGTDRKDPSWNNTGATSSKQREKNQDTQESQKPSSGKESSDQSDSPSPTASPDLTEQSSKKQRAPITKKEKKSTVQRPKKKEIEELSEEKVIPTRRKEPRTAMDSYWDDDDDYKLEAPELPQLPEEEETSQSAKNRMNLQDSSFLKSDMNEIITEEMRIRRREYEMTVAKREIEEKFPQKTLKGPEWLQTRFALSQQACRFDLPMDLKKLETMSASDYLRSHCILSSRRQSLYHKFFMRHKDKSGFLLKRDLEKALSGVLVNSITTEQVKEICDLVQLEEDPKVDFKLFAGMAAMAERVLFFNHLTNETRDIADNKKEKIESADFCNLEWKLRGLNVNPPVRNILHSL